MNTHTTTNDLFQNEVIAVLDNAGITQDFDLDGLREDLMDHIDGDMQTGYHLTLTDDELWDIVAKHDTAA